MQPDTSATATPTKLSAFAKTGTSVSEPARHSEGPVAKAIEEQTAKVPSDAFLWSAFAAIGVSLFLQASGRKHGSLFVGQWVAPLLILGVYNKLVKVAGSDRLAR